MKIIQLSNLNIGILKKTDYLLSTQRDFPLRDAAPKLRYLLCSTARSGSTLVADVLHSTQAAGDPQEYLNPRLMAAWLRQQGHLDGRLPLDDYLRDLEHRRTTTNGVFGMKAHYEHLIFLWREEPEAIAQFLRGFDRVVLLTRRDKLAQAVSLYKARVTQIWTSQDRAFLEPGDPRLSAHPRYEPAHISRALADIIAQEHGWRLALTKLQLPFLEVIHEDFLTDMNRWSRQLFSTLELGSDVDLSPPRIQRQGNDNDPMLVAFRHELGLV